MWASIHPGLEHYVETHRASRNTVVRPRDVRKLPPTGWEPGACPSRLDVELPIIPADLVIYLVDVDSATSEDRPTVALPGTGVHEGTLSQFIQAHQPDRRSHPPFFHMGVSGMYTSQKSRALLTMGTRFQIPVEMLVQIPVGFVWSDPYQRSCN